MQWQMYSHMGSKFLIIFSFYKVDADKWWPGCAEALIMPSYEVPGVKS